MVSFSDVLVHAMSRYNWVWNGYLFRGSDRPFLVSVCGEVVLLPGQIDEDLDFLRAKALEPWIAGEWSKDLESSTIKHVLLFLDGNPDSDRFSQIWQWAHRTDTMIGFVAPEPTLKWGRQASAIVDEHYEGGMRSFLRKQTHEATMTKTDLSNPEFDKILVEIVDSKPTSAWMKEFPEIEDILNGKLHQQVLARHKETQR